MVENELFIVLGQVFIVRMWFSLFSRVFEGNIVFFGNLPVHLSICWLDPNEYRQGTRYLFEISACLPRSYYHCELSLWCFLVLENFETAILTCIQFFELNHCVKARLLSSRIYQQKIWKSKNKKEKIFSPRKVINFRLESTKINSKQIGYFTINMSINYFLALLLVNT